MEVASSVSRRPRTLASSPRRRHEDQLTTQPGRQGARGQPSTSRVRGASPQPRVHRPRGHQLPPVDRRDMEDGIFLGLDGDLGRMVEKVWNDERQALRRGRTAQDLYN